MESDSLPPAKTAIPRRPYGGLSLWGVPYGGVDIEYAADQIRELYFEKFPNPNGPMQALLEYNEKIVSRCGILMSFSSVLIAFSLYIATNPRLLSTHWQRSGFYFALMIWVAAMLLLLFSLRHRLPAPWKFGSRSDLDDTIKLFLRRMGYYNLALLASIICFLIILILLAPISVSAVDHIFGAPRH